MKSPFLMVIADGTLMMFPVVNIKSIQMPVSQEEAEQVRLPGHAIRERDAEARRGLAAHRERQAVLPAPRVRCGCAPRCPCSSASSLRHHHRRGHGGERHPAARRDADVAPRVRRRLDGGLGAAPRLRRAGRPHRLHHADHQPALHDVQRVAALHFACAARSASRSPTSPPTTSTDCCSGASPSIPTRQARVLLGAGSWCGRCGRWRCSRVLIGAGVPASWRWSSPRRSRSSR